MQPSMCRLTSPLPWIGTARTRGSGLTSIDDTTPTPTFADNLTLALAFHEKDFFALTAPEAWLFLAALAALGLASRALTLAQTPAEPAKAPATASCAPA